MSLDALLALCVLLGDKLSRVLHLPSSPAHMPTDSEHFMALLPLKLVAVIMCEIPLSSPSCAQNLGQKLSWV